MQTIETDVIVIGAGPAGLCLARALDGSGLRVTVLERETEQCLRAPKFDGREIALTQRSVRLMRDLGMWRRLPPDECHPLCEARVFDGRMPEPLKVGGGDEPLGWLVPNHAIRAAAFEAVAECGNVTVHAGVRIAAVDADAAAARARLEDGRTFAARLIVAADGRFSETRRALGIATRMHDFGRAMLVCRVTHERPHDDTAWEWFDRGQTLARLPLGRATPVGHRSSIVLTLPGVQMRELQAMDDASFAQDIARRFHGRLGAVSDPGERHVYPLVGAWATRFAGTRVALLGDAAVGMHPVTAHGFNLGLLGVERLAAELRDAAASGTDPGDAARLARYARGHRLATAPLHLATRGIVALFTDDRAPARALRAGVLRASAGFPPFRRLLASFLSDRRGADPFAAALSLVSEQGDGRPRRADRW
ncbi:5-demethoxyubiquinol-8 5-hydroxylase UbiM [Lysobacter arvi]|uniref:5-demethoxyubiquinol-8 5-hydroxylase UbiM n=1 Tax=Lysobacter arvi TaxID=3038776 RepID=A0ABU1CHL9_9GAMM|nr:5-demethoxyubiquinol-8 5-hydroxylase UbiM [Lysobacter arvi]MDR0184437.1 5-demethoxyubiquinol-8 5-hydroxylase UbiM [Lysobacter arvi]